MTSTTDIAASVEALIDLALRTSDDKLAGVLVFEGRDHYVAFVSAWKARHAGVVASILTEKAFRRDKANPIPARNAAQERRQSLRGHSHALQVIRAAGKDVARAAREERLRTAA